MVDKLEKIRLMMAEQRYIEAQQLLEQSLRLTTSKELLGLYIEIHLLQGSPLPYHLTIKLLNLMENEAHESLDLIRKLPYQGIESRVLEIKLYVRLGELNGLYQKISEFYLFLYERKIPRVFDEVKAIRKKYFGSDFTLELQELVLSADRGWSEDFEVEVKRLLQESFQKFNFKNKNEKFLQLEKILSSIHFNNGLRIYGHLLSLYNQGIQSKADYKKIIELVLYFEDLPLKAILLNLMDKLDLNDIARKYAQIMKGDKNYSFVHFEKYFPHLKCYFIETKLAATKVELPKEEIDLTLDGDLEDTEIIEWIEDSEISSDYAMAESLKFLEYEVSGWLNLAVGFIQSDFSKSALLCAKKVKEAALDDIDFLKGSYLAVHALMKLRDYRLALDYCYEAIEKSRLETDILSFSYLEVELLIQLKEKASALRVLKSIQEIDNSYRLSSKMLKRLNEI